MHPTNSSANYGNSGDSGNASDYGDSRVSDHPTCPGWPWIPRSPDHPISYMDGLEDSISDFLICSQAQRTLLSLWILHTYSVRQTSFLTPYLNIYSPVEQSGKSVCLAFLRALCAQPWLASGVSTATLTRKIFTHHPTVLLDNWHTTFRGRDQQPITGFLLQGCHSAQPFTLMEKGALCQVDAYCPKAFAGLASLPPTLAQRSIPIVLQRSLPHEEVIPVYRLLDPKNTRDFISWAQQWTQGNLDQIFQNIARFEHRKSLGALSPHQQACAQPLLGLAETIGGDWPERACTALLEVFREEQERQPSPIQLLSDVRDAFAHHHHQERIFTAELLEYLNNLDHRTWYEWSKGQSMNAHSLSALLRKSFNIYPRTQRRGKQKLRGYQKADFTDAWNRYLPAQQPENTTADCPGRQESVPLDIGFRSPDHPITPDKQRLVSMSQFKAGCEKRWLEVRSLLKRYAAKAAGLFVTPPHLDRLGRDLILSTPRSVISSHVETKRFRHPPK